MNELFFPVVGAMVVFFAAVPLLTLAARAVLAAAPWRKHGVDQHLGPWRLTLIVLPALGPVIWLVSAVVHQTEEEAPLAACLMDHLGGELCRDVGWFGLVLFSILGFGVLHRVRREHQPGRPTHAPASRAAARRVQRICDGHPALAAFAPRIRVVGHGVAPACTRGLFRPRIEVEAEVVEHLDDDELEAVLLHEVEHAQARDPLRLFVAQVALTINPLGRLLAPELSRYRFAREAHCDRRAVQRGADPLALARSIVAVARPDRAPAFVAGLGGHGIGGVRVRVHLLLSYATARPGPARRRSPVDVATPLAALSAVLPHVMGTAPLDALHHGVERAALLLGLG